MKFQFILHYRYGTIYREVIDTKKREWCSIMDGMQTHMYIMLIIRQLKESAPKLFHKCPYQGDYQLYNITVDESKAFDLFPEGYYKLKTRIAKIGMQWFCLRMRQMRLVVKTNDVPLNALVIRKHLFRQPANGLFQIRFSCARIG